MKTLAEVLLSIALDGNAISITTLRDVVGGSEGKAAGGPWCTGRVDSCGCEGP